MNRKSGNNSRTLSKTFSQTYGSLEPKNLLASIYHNPTNGILFIGGDSGNNVGQVSLTGGTINAEIDGITFSGLSSEISDIVFIGYDGNDTFTNLSSRGSSMYGHLGSDTLIGGSGDDNLVGGSGDDNIQGNEGDDRVVGANGNDTLEGGPGNDRMFGTAGVNTIFGGLGDDIIYGSPEADEIHGDGGTDKLYALGGDDMIYTGSGGLEGGSFAQGDLAMGHGGNDQFFGNSGLDIFYGGDGNDIMLGGVGENRMHGQAGNDTMTGGDKSDYMTGAEGDDTFEGGGGVDFFNVGNGNDTIKYTTSYTPSDVFVASNGDTRVQGELVSNATTVQFSDRNISPTQANYSVQDETVFIRVNGYRTSNSQGFISKPTDLANYALNWSQTMAAQGQEANSPRTDQQTLVTGGRTFTAENVASVADTGQTNAEIANYFHNYWQNDFVANGFMLRSDIMEVGIGIVNSGGTWWATQIFTD